MSEPVNDPVFEALLQYLKRSRGFDFTGYKRPSLMRLMKKRMQQSGVQSYGDYLDYLQVYPMELNQLFDSLLLNVTAFFRDKEPWDYLQEVVLPRLLEIQTGSQPLRFWCAACASGEEPYSLAIVLAELLGTEEFRQRVKIYATDLDEDALTTGRQASYTVKQLSNVSENLREKYFEQTGIDYIVCKELRRSVIFGRHDLVQDAPISRLDLLVCRNILMYFNPETQSRILARFHFALNNPGFLFVGKAEMLLTHAHLFTPKNLKYRIFAKVQKTSLRDRLLIMSESGNTEASHQLVNNLNLRDEAFEVLAHPQIVLDADNHLVMANRKARIWFGLSTQDIGRPLKDLQLSYRPTELRAPIEQASNERRVIQIQEVEYSQANNLLYLDIEITPLLDGDSDVLGTTVVFNDGSQYKYLQRELERSTEELETAYEELQSTNEELETTNEELQSTNEELETTNEELQSTNEELETMNEELQSSNEELQTTNEENRNRTKELNRINAFMEAILTSLRLGMIVLDERLSVQLWNSSAEKLWGLRSDEAEGRFFFDLDIGLPLEQLREKIRTCQLGKATEAVVVEAINRRGKTIHCRVICTTLMVNNQAQGVILLMEERSE
ncbi:MAG: PAS domain-containing protein [Kastovskya adunca ATA6-11-RM4]|jgi:two-component system CheB/CheR fusion protein|nr:PAS domain-containing protein [Kastovskya adunca ATA6-11-RM4]